MSESKDLTRWNRAGLSRFRYVDGNAVSYLEILRKQLYSRFKDPDSGLCEWLNPSENIPLNEIEAKDENLIQRQQRLNREKQRVLAMYHQDRRDWLWEISRTFARASHILTEHADAFANERFLGTASEWDNVRKLVDMLDYHPAPPASAFTPLVILAKEKSTGENTTALVEKGFQVVHSPAKGSKVIFEALEDLLIDPELNEIRLSGWDQSEDPAVPASVVSATGQARQFSAAANESVIYLQGVGEKYYNSLKKKQIFKIKDFNKLDISKLSSIGIGLTRLKEFKAKATDIIDFKLEADWSAIDDWTLPRILSESLASLLSQTRQTVANILLLQQRIGMVAADLDQPLFENLSLKDLLQPSAYNETGSYLTGWIKPGKPEVMANQVAIVMDKSQDWAEAVTITEVSDKQFEGIQPEQTILDIELLPSPLQDSWPSWKKNKLALLYSSRWQRKSWLNGSDVIRTVEPHGFSKEDYIGWKTDDSWQFASVTEVDKRNLRLDYTGNLPVAETDLYQLSSIESAAMPADYEAIVLLKEGGNNKSPEIKPVVPGLKDIEDIFESVFTINTDASGSALTLPLMPPASLPKIGSFLLPTPFLPMDLVKAAVELLLNLGVMIIPSTEEIVFKGLPLTGLPDVGGVTELDKAAKSLFSVLDSMEYENENMIKWNASLADQQEKEDALKAVLESVMESSGEVTTIFNEVTEIKENEDDEGIGPLLAIDKNASVKAIVENAQPLYMFEGKPEKVEIGDWVIAQFGDGNRALKIRAIEQFIDSDKSDSFSLEFGNTGEYQDSLLYVSADFRGDLTAEGAAINSSPAEPDQLELEKIPENLTIGRTVLFTCEGHEPVIAKIKSITGNVIQTSPPLGACSKGNLIIRGNVVAAGHGVSKPAKILGSGDATQSNQSFILAVNELSFTPDATMISGVIAALEVEVSGRIWQQVSTLKNSAPDDHHYAIRMTEDGFVKILFGDGVYGRRLPTGSNNVRVSYRVGSGVSGNVPSKGLEKAVNPHQLVDAILQPLSAVGGGDMESVTSLRENAPSSVLTLERAVSLSDYSYLAAAQSSVWQAKAFSEVLHGGRLECVKVVIVPAGGEASPVINESIRGFLQQHATPGVQVSVLSFEKQRFRLKVSVAVNPDAFVADQVETKVATALLDHFTLKNRKLGEHLYLSEVYKIVEAVQGVENSICVLDDDSRLQRITAPDKKTVVYLYSETDSTATELVVSSEEFKP